MDENLDPVVNLTHVLTCLNKLDAGSDERMMLTARDEQSCLVVSYKDVKTCIESAYRCVFTTVFIPVVESTLTTTATNYSDLAKKHSAR